jgi:predicted transcriptional regulator YdeE
MGTDIVIKEKFNIAGIGVRTNNRDIEKIRELWDRFFKEQIIEKINNKINPEKIYCVYTDYESDLNGDYTCIIGFEVDDIDYIADGLLSRTIQRAGYQVFSDTGNINKVTPCLWQKIWNTELDRLYKADFEIYNTKTMLSENSEVKIYIGIN